MNRDIAILAGSAIIAALLIVFALHGCSVVRTVNFLAPAIWE